MSTLITTTAQIGTIKDAGGNQTAMTIDSTGRVLQPNKPAFHIRLQSVSNVDFTSGVNLAGTTYYQSATLEEQGGSNFDISTGQYVAPLTGFYFFHFGSIWAPKIFNSIVPRIGIIGEVQTPTGFQNQPIPLCTGEKTRIFDGKSRLRARYVHSYHLERQNLSAFSYQHWKD